MGGLGNMKYFPGSLVGPNNIELIERTKRVGKVYYAKFRCPYDGKVFESRITHIVQGKVKSCGCKWEQSKQNAKNLGSENLIGKKFGHLTVLEKTDKRANFGCIVWKCQCDCKRQNIVYVDTKSLKSGHTQSCGCKKSKGETKIASILDSLHISFIQQFIFDECKDIISLRFDFYLPDYNTCIEYDGLQHYKPIEYFGGEENYIESKRKDNIKNKFCEEHNIKLIRIPYTDYNKIDSDYIIKCISDGREDNE